MSAIGKFIPNQVPGMSKPARCSLGASFDIPVRTVNSTLKGRPPSDSGCRSSSTGRCQVARHRLRNWRRFDFPLILK